MWVLPLEWLVISYSFREHVVCLFSCLVVSELLSLCLFFYLFSLPHSAVTIQVHVRICAAYAWNVSKAQQVGLLILDIRCGLMFFLLGGCFVLLSYYKIKYVLMIYLHIFVECWFVSLYLGFCFSFSSRMLLGLLFGKT